MIQIVGMVDPHRMGFGAPATIGVAHQSPFLEETAAAVASRPEVSYLILVSGENDLIVEVICRDKEHLAEFLQVKLKNVASIQRTQTSMILHTYTMAYGATPVLTSSGQSGAESQGEPVGGWQLAEDRFEDPFTSPASRNAVPGTAGKMNG